jgi:hypothetical protein
MKTIFIASLLALSPTMASAKNDIEDNRIEEYKHLNERIELLEQAVRLQTLTTEAIRKDNYQLACKAQQEAAIATHKANIRDVKKQSDIQYVEICTFLNYTTDEIPAWLKPVAGFEPAGVYVKRTK